MNETAEKPDERTLAEKLKPALESAAKMVAVRNAVVRRLQAVQGVQAQEESAGGVQGTNVDPYKC